MRFLSPEAVLSAVLTGALVLAGCGGEARSGESVPKKTGGSRELRMPLSATGTLEELAAQVGCKPGMQVDAEELRQGVCTMGSGRYVLVTFKTSKNQRDWLAEAKPYGGTYLVGRRWVAAGPVKLLRKVRDRIGGGMERGEDHSGSMGRHSGGAGAGSSGTGGEE